MYLGQNDLNENTVFSNTFVDFISFSWNESSPGGSRLAERFVNNAYECFYLFFLMDKKKNKVKTILNKTYMNKSEQLKMVQTSYCT